MRTKWVAPVGGSLHNEIPRPSRPTLGTGARRLRWFGTLVYQEHVSTSRRDHLLVAIGTRSAGSNIGLRVVPRLVRATRRLI